MGENNSKWNIWQRIKFQNIQAAHTIQWQKNKQPSQKGEKDLNRHFSKEDNRWLTHGRMLIIRETQIKTTMSYWSERPSSKSLQTIHAGEGVEKREYSCTSSGNVNWYSHYGRRYAAKSLQLCPTLCDPIDGSPPGSPISGILQAKTLEWVAISFSNAWKWKVKVKLLSRVRLSVTPGTAAYQAPPFMGFSRQEYWSGVPTPSRKENGMEIP